MNHTIKTELPKQESFKIELTAALHILYRAVITNKSRVAVNFPNSGFSDYYYSLCMLKFNYNIHGKNNPLEGNPSGL